MPWEVVDMMISLSLLHRFLCKFHTFECVKYLHKHIRESVRESEPWTWTPSHRVDHTQKKDTSPIALTSTDGVMGIPIDLYQGERKSNRYHPIRTKIKSYGLSRALWCTWPPASRWIYHGGGLSAGFQRLLTGQNMFISDYTYDGSAGSYGHVAHFEVRSYTWHWPNTVEGGKIVCQKGALLCASHTVDITDKKSSYTKIFNFENSFEK